MVYRSAPVNASAAAPSAPQPSQTGTAAPAEVVTALEQDAKPVIQWSEVQQERARALFAKYGLSLEPEEWMSPRNLEVQRVEKPIRMRVRRTCHRCQTTFGSDRVCVNCQHVRCKDCPRYPLARTTEEKEARALAKAKGKQAEQPLESVAANIDNTKTRQKPAPITMASRTGGQDLVHKPIKQRVRRTCHQCQTLFKGTSTQCESCGHTRCKICPRDPYVFTTIVFTLLEDILICDRPKLKKYPDGYPGDEDPPIERPSRTWKKPRMRVRYYCNKCDNLYKPGETNCNGCGEEKGPNTRRQP